MTTPGQNTPGQNTPGQNTPGQTRGGDSGNPQGAWGPVARLLSLQLLTVIAVTAVITGIYALTGPHKNHQATAAGTAPVTTASAAPTSKPAASKPTASTPTASTPTASPPPSSPPASPTATAPASPAASLRPEAASRLKVDVLNQSGPASTAAKTASRVRALGWTVGRVSDFRGNVSATTVYYPTGEAKAAHELAGALPGKPRVLPRFSTLADNRLTVIITR